jgi:hypothetical protein
MHAATIAWYNALQTAHLQLRMAQMAREHQAEQFAHKLDEMLLVNEDLERRVAQAERALEEIASLEREEGAPATPAGTQRVLAELRQVRAAKAERAKAYRELVRSLQNLVDNGQLKAVVGPEGRVRFVIPRQLDVTDPWSAATQTD